MKLDNFKPTDANVMRAMFDLAEIQSGEKHVDMGSGDGRFVVEATRRRAKSIGYEIDEEIAEKSRRSCKINIFTEDCFDVDVSDIDIVTHYFTALPGIKFFMDKLHKEMKNGSRIVCHGYIIHDWKPEKIIVVDRQKLCLYRK